MCKFLVHSLEARKERNSSVLIDGKVEFSHCLWRDGSMDLDVPVELELPTSAAASDYCTRGLNPRCNFNFGSRG